MKIFALMFLFALSANAGTLKITTEDPDTLFIAKPTRSCAAYAERRTTMDIPSAHFTVMEPELTFESDRDEVAVIEKIDVQMNHPGLVGGSYKCSIAGDELNWLFADGWTIPWTNVMTAKSSRKATNGCALKCGGISFVRNSHFWITATITVYGFTLDSRGEESPVKAETKVEIENTP